MVQEQDCQAEKKWSQVCTHVQWLHCEVSVFMQSFHLSDASKFHNEETPEGDAVEVATRSQSSAEPTFAHTSVADAYKEEQYCMTHISSIPQPNTGETQCVLQHHTTTPM